ncbi:MAG: type IV secretory system conjugative DNA transfer family protein [Solirubrobacteraceae bacterium]
MANKEQEQAVMMLAGVAIVAFGLAAVTSWGSAYAAAWVHAGELPSLNVNEAVTAATSPEFWSSDPASAYPRDVQRLLPGGWGFWSTVALVFGLLVATALAVVREIAERMATPIADRRWYHIFRGRRPQAFGRYRIVKRALVVDAPRPERVIVGTIANPPALVAVQEHAQICAIAEPHSGTTSGLIVPAVLEHAGPVVTTAINGDVARATMEQRARDGEAFIWDPFGPHTDSWDPLRGCEDWSYALTVARWLGHALAFGENESTEYYDEVAQDLAAPLLHAAALGPGRTIVDAYNWVRDRDIETPSQILTEAGAEDPRARLTGIYAFNERRRDAIIGAVQFQLKAYGHPAVARASRRGQGITPEDLFDGRGNTVYIVSGREHQRLLAPLVVTMLSSLVYWATELEQRERRRIVPTALFALDETAQIAPLQELPQILSVAHDIGIRFVTVWHSLAQMRERYGNDAAAEILAMSQAKVFLGSISDEGTRRELLRLLGKGVDEHDGTTAQALQRLRAGQGLLIHSEQPPLFFTQRPVAEERPPVVAAAAP